MSIDIFLGLISNAILLMALSVVYEISYIVHIKSKKSTDLFKGILVGVIGLAIMSIPFKLSTGIVFDTRSILISVTALTFGTFPTIIAALITIIYRIIIGGTGMWMGISAIITSAVIGIVWRRFMLDKKTKIRWFNIYLFGITVHIVMLLCSFIMPYPTSVNVISQIGLHIMIIYPFSTVLLSMLLIHQKERNEALIQAAEAESRYRSIFENNHAVMLIIQPEDGQIIDVNPAAANFYGWSIETMKSMKIDDINTLPFKQLKLEIENSYLEKKSHFIFKHRRAHDKPVDVEVYSGPIVFNGKILIYSIVHNISERVAADKALKESEKRFRYLVESAPDAIFIQTEGRFSFVNKFAIMLFGAESAEELIGMLVMDRFHPDYHNSIEERIEILNNEKKVVPPVEEVFLKMDGTPVCVEAAAIPINYDDMDGAIVFVRDITERKKFEHDKTEMEAQLRQQQKLEAIGTLAGGVAHEINNPINGIMNYAQLVLDEIDKNSQPAKYADEIIHETERISVIVKNLLQFSRQEKQSHSYASVYDIINQTISLIKTIVKKDQISLDVKLDENLSDIKCRSQQIQQVLMNLLTNARDALNEKYAGYSEDKIIRLRCSQFMNHERRWIKITVEDNGNGIPAELHEKIFDPFFSTKPKDKGTGLGLSISFGIVKDHHGEISIDTKEGSYTKFILDLPVDNGWEL